MFMKLLITNKKKYKYDYKLNYMRTTRSVVEVLEKMSKELTLIKEKANFEENKEEENR